MPNTVPNQKVVHVHRDMPDKNKKEGNFLLIKKENWYAANKDLEPYGLQLYLYIAGNKDGFDFALSQEAAEREAGIKKTSYHKYVNLMIEKGYLVPHKENSNVYDFYEVPKRKEDKEAVSPCELNSLPDGNDDLRGRLVTSQGNKEIYNNRPSRNPSFVSGKTGVLNRFWTKIEEI